MEDEKIIHRRLVCNTTPFFRELEKLGYEEIDSKSHGLDKVRRFQKGNKIVHSSHHHLVLIEKIDIGDTKESHKGLKLQEIKDKEKIHHTGLTVHDEMLKFFTNRTPQEIENE